MSRLARVFTRVYALGMTNTTATIAHTIREQITTGALMALGARELIATESGLRFTASILPFTKSGARGTRARAMRVEVTLNGLDYYDVVVSYAGRDYSTVEHYAGDNIDAFSLARILLALDYDGPTALNPRML
ncbi:hypothetical protein SEA_ZETA1847_70 [Microbacterium phage Zeta1847]|uniref:Uncharacterized protein n=1 Tax=Microbacterium phage Zeta1847 TaxID=2201444 RepID=A0A2Z4Q9L1_9CAUD|nr:hypothetical protein HOT46_gp70 [Microbacterium phage Zeta1847]AWY06704.1 hypothetical protein SEA_ZETA1847_70 [Microbacterium phage Zeta1847]